MFASMRSLCAILVDKSELVMELKYSFFKSFCFAAGEYYKTKFQSVAALLIMKTSKQILD